MTEIRVFVWKPVFTPRLGSNACTRRFIDIVEIYISTRGCSGIVDTELSFSVYYIRGGVHSNHVSNFVNYSPGRNQGRKRKESEKKPWRKRGTTANRAIIEKKFEDRNRIEKVRKV